MRSRLRCSPSGLISGSLLDGRRAAKDCLTMFRGMAGLCSGLYLITRSESIVSGENKDC